MESSQAFYRPAMTLELCQSPQIEHATQRLLNTINKCRERTWTERHAASAAESLSELDQVHVHLNHTEITSEYCV